MLRCFYACCNLDIEIVARSALLVQGAQAPEGAAMFYRARDPADGGREKYCIPATTLKGVWRSAAEAILRSFEHPWLACDPFEEDEENKGKLSKSCSKRLDGDPRANTPRAYAATCPACRLFGSTAHTGLLQLDDAWAVGDPKPETKTGIAIDRFTGGVKAHALYSYDALSAGTRFTSHMTIHNCEFWHLGLLALVAREMSNGQAHIGSGTRRGLGHVQITWQRAEFRYPADLYARAVDRAAGGGKLASAQALAGGSDRVDYPTAEPWFLPDLEPLPAAGWADALWIRFVVGGNDLKQLAVECVERALAPKLQAGPVGFAYQPPTSREVHYA